jgi:Cytochrome P460
LKHNIGYGALLALLWGASLAADSRALAAGVTKSTESVVDPNGQLRVPTDYRERFQYLGTWAVAAEKAPGSQQLHVVYASPGTRNAFRRSGQFPAGAILVKEVYSANAAAMTTGTVSREQDLKGWFVMVKDSEGGHPGNPLWGDGWGWSWFDADQPIKSTSTDYRKDCLGCHVPAKSTDWIYTQGYPSLRK